MNIDIKNNKPYNEIIEYKDIIKCVEEREEKNNNSKEHTIFDYDNEDYLNNFFCYNKIIWIIIEEKI